MVFLQSTKAKTAQDVQAEIGKLNADRDTMRRRMNEIEQAIGDLWGNGTTKLEAEYGTISVRLKASDKVLERLENELKEAEISDLLNSLLEAQADCGNLAKIEQTARLKRDKAREALEAAESELRDLERQSTIVSGKERQITAQLERRGMGHEKVNALLLSMNEKTA
jgi:chromosome segregation ATPase